MSDMGMIAFENLREEMLRNRVSTEQIAEYLGIAEELLKYKFSREIQINLDEALCIARKFFPERDVYYLFKELIPEDSTKQTA